jgi:hypothetical protein
MTRLRKRTFTMKAVSMAAGRLTSWMWNTSTKPTKPPTTPSAPSQLTIGTSEEPARLTNATTVAA